MSGAALSAAVDAAVKHSDKPSTLGWGSLEVLGGAVSLVNLPLGLLLGLSGAVGAAMSDRKALDQARMSDEWLSQVAQSKDVSKEGLALLARALADQGFVTVADAVRWVELEKSIAERQARQEEAAAAKREPGASALLDRARLECADLLESSVLDKAVSLVRSVGKFTPDALTLAAKLVGAKK